MWCALTLLTPLIQEAKAKLPVVEPAAAKGEAAKPRQRKPKTGVKTAMLMKKRKAADAADTEDEDNDEHVGDEMRAEAGEDDDDFESERKASQQPYYRLKY